MATSSEQRGGVERTQKGRLIQKKREKEEETNKEKKKEKEKVCGTWGCTHTLQQATQRRARMQLKIQSPTAAISIMVA